MPDSHTKSPAKDFDRDALLEQLGRARQALLDAQRCMRPRSGLSRSASAIIAEIDEFAQVLTGTEDFFHARAHGTPARRSG
ncbi:hypothetical protein [Roseibium sp. M-1]